MKRTILNALAGIVISLAITSCSFTAPVTATSNEVGKKVGEAKTTRILVFFFDGGDASIQKAAQNGNLKKISTVDFKTSVGFLGLWTTYRTIVTGE